VQLPTLKILIFMLNTLTFVCDQQVAPRLSLWQNQNPFFLVQFSKICTSKSLC